MPRPAISNVLHSAPEARNFAAEAPLRKLIEPIQKVCRYLAGLCIEDPNAADEQLNVLLFCDLSVRKYWKQSRGSLETRTKFPTPRP
jgi:hypothetical protein